VLADALLRLGDEGDRGRALAELAALEADVAAGCRRCRLETMLLSAAAYARADDPSRARALLLAWDGEARTPSAVARFRRSRAEGLVRLAEGDAEGAELALRAAVEAADRLGMAVEAMRARIDLSRATQDKAQAVEALTTAMEAAVSIGASTERSQAERALRAHGVRGWRRGAARTGATPVDRLSARELEVARLVAGGASNREIANALFLSPKTIETHVSNVLAKVGARNRTELASLLTGHEARGA
jgi:DNA-binding NarL/FixJ family response regulator